MKKLLLLTLAAILCLGAAAQTKKTRNAAATDSKSVTARKISVTYTEGLKAFYSGRPDEAMRIFQQIVLDNPAHDASYFMMAKIYTSKRDFHSAEQSLKQAIKANKGNIWYVLELADVYMQMQDYAKAVKLWEQVCAEKNNNEFYLYALSECYLNLRKFDKVIATYDRMEELVGHNDEITKAKVQLWLYQDKVREAVGEYDKLIKLFPHNAEYYVMAGRIYQSNNMLAQAYPYYEKAFELNSDNPDVYSALADYWAAKGDIEHQFRVLESLFANPVIEEADKSARMRNFTAEVLKSRTETNIGYVERLADVLIATHPDYSKGYEYKADVYVLRSQYRQSIPYFEKALNFDNTDFSVWEDFCYALKQLNDWAPLLKFEEDIQDIYSYNAQMMYNLALAHKQNGNHEKAVQCLRKASSSAFEPELKNAIRQTLQELEK